MMLYTYCMRTFGGIVIILFTVPLFLIAIASATLKFQLLQADFWESAFEKDNVYSKITDIVKESVVSQTVEKGGNALEIKVITDLITPENVKDFVNKNLENLLDYSNGIAKELMVYIPVGRAPKGFLPVNFENLPETMPVTSLLTKLNISGISQTEIQYIPLIGRATLLLLVLSLSLLLICFLVLFVFIDTDRKFVWPGIAFIVNGFVLLLVYVYSYSIRSQIVKNTFMKGDISETVFETIAYPAIKGVGNIYFIVGICAFACGVGLILLKKLRKKPGVN